MTKPRTGAKAQIPGNEQVEPPTQEFNADAQIPDSVIADVSPNEAATQLSMPADASDLPDVSDIDPKTIKRAVLTKQGWVCPAEIA